MPLPEMPDTPPIAPDTGEDVRPVVSTQSLFAERLAQTRAAIEWTQTLPNPREYAKEQDRMQAAAEQSQQLRSMFPRYHAIKEAQERALLTPEIQQWVADRPDRAAFLAAPFVPGAMHRYTKALLSRNLDSLIEAGHDIERRPWLQQVADAWRIGQLDTELNYHYGIRAMGGGYDANRLYVLEHELARIPQPEITGWVANPVRMVPQYWSYAKGGIQAAIPSAAVGAGVGSLAGGIGAKPGALVGGAWGFKKGFGLRMVVLSLGGMRRQVEALRDERGRQIDPWAANLISIPFGLAVAGLNKVAFNRLADAVTGVPLKGHSLTSLSNAMLRTARADPSVMRQLGQGVVGLASAGLNEFYTEIAQEGTTLVGAYMAGELHRALHGFAIEPAELDLVSHLVDAGVAGFQASFGLGLLPMAGRVGLAHRANMRNASWRLETAQLSQAVSDLAGDSPESASALLLQSKVSLALADASAVVESGILSDPAVAAAFEAATTGGVEAIMAAGRDGSDVRVRADKLLANLPKERHAAILGYLAQDPEHVRKLAAEDRRERRKAREAEAPARQEVLVELGRLNTEMESLGYPSEYRGAMVGLLDQVGANLAMKSGQSVSFHLRRLHFGVIDGQKKPVLLERVDRPPAPAQEVAGERQAPAPAPERQAPRERRATPSLARLIGEGPDGPDILTAIAEQGRLRRPTADERGGEFDPVREGQTRLQGVHARLIAPAGESGLAPDQMAAILETQGIGDGSPMTMWRLVDEAMEARRQRKDVGAEMDLGEAEAAGMLAMPDTSDPAVAQALPEALRDLTDLASQAGDDDLAIGLRDIGESLGIDQDLPGWSDPTDLWQPPVRVTEVDGDVSYEFTDRAGRDLAETRASGPDVPGQGSFLRQQDLSPDGQQEQTLARGETRPSQDPVLSALVRGVKVEGHVFHAGDRISTLMAGLVRQDLSSNQEFSSIVPLRGATVRGPNDAAVLLAAWRSPFVERTTWLLVRNGEVIRNGLHSIGTIDGTTMPSNSEYAGMLADHQQGDVLYICHNHPSGDVTPSDADRGAYAGAKQRVAEVAPGVQLQTLIINGDRAFVNLGVDPDAGEVAVDIGPTFRPVVGAVVGGAPDAIAISKGWELAPGVHLAVHLNTKGRIVGIEAFDHVPFRGEEFDSRDRAGGATTILVGPDVEVAALRTGQGDHRVVDMIRTTPDGEAQSLRETGQYVLPPELQDTAVVVDLVREASATETAWDTPASKRQITNVLKRLDPNALSPELIAALKRHKGTAWGREARKAIALRAALRATIAGEKVPFDSVARAKDAKRALDLVKRSGIDGVFEYLNTRTRANSWLDHASKPGWTLRTSFLDCIHATKGCAKNCYAANGRVFTAMTVSQEMLAIAIEHDPERVGRMVHGQYSRTAEGVRGHPLRINERGDLSPGLVRAIAEMNRLGTVVQVFSKRPDLLRQIDRRVNLASFLSIDNTNEQVAFDNPDLLLAVVWSGPQDNAMLERLGPDRIAVVLPIRSRFNRLNREQIDTLPAWATRRSCPIDAQWKVIGTGHQDFMAMEPQDRAISKADLVQKARFLGLTAAESQSLTPEQIAALPDGQQLHAKMGLALAGEWMCTDCDNFGGVGCYLGRISTEMHSRLNEVRNREVNGLSVDDVNQGEAFVMKLAERIQNANPKSGMVELMAAELARLRAELDGRRTAEDRGRADRKVRERELGYRVGTLADTARDGRASIDPSLSDDPLVLRQQATGLTPEWREITILQRQVDQAYKAGEWDLAERLDADLEARLEAFESREVQLAWDNAEDLAAIEDGVGVDEQLAFDWAAHLRGEPTIADMSDDMLVGRVAGLTGADSSTMTRADAIAEMQSAYAKRMQIHVRLQQSQRDGTYDLEQRAWHATGNTVPYDKLRTEFVGGPGGEGAQAFGWGLYLSGSEDIGRDYLRNLSQAKITIAGESATVSDWLQRWETKTDGIAHGVLAALQQAKSQGHFDQIIAAYKTLYVADGQFKHSNDAEFVANLQQMVSEIEGADVSQEGRLYEVDIPESSELLQYDKPLSQQPEGVRAKIIRLYDELGISDRLTEETTGDRIYAEARNAIARRTPGLAMMRAGEMSATAGEAVAAAFRSVGIDGHEYPAGTLSGVESGDRNFVIWTDEAMQIQRFEQAAIDASTGLPLNDDGTVTVWHHTSEQSASDILASGRLTADAEPDVYVTTEQSPTTGYGDAAVPLRVDPSHLILDDEFPSGRRDFRMQTGRPGGSVGIVVDPSIMRQEPNRFDWDADQNAPRGQIRIAPDGAIIELTSRSDATTVPHELSHFYLAELRRVARMEGASEMAVEHWRQITQWLGAEPEAKLTVAQEERFAGGFETFIMEGQAPLPQLVGLFRKMRRWFLGVYRRADAIGVKLTPEAHEVYATMLATDEEARAMGQIYALTYMTPEQAQAMGMAEDDRRRYLDLMEAAVQEAADRAMDMQSRDLGKRIAGWRRAARREMLQTPVYAAMREIRAFGLMDARFARDQLPADQYRAMRNRNLLSKIDEKGVPAHHILKAHGFERMSDFGKAVLEAESEQNFIKRRTSEMRQADPEGGAIEAALLESPAFMEAQRMSGRYLSRALGGKQSDATWSMEQARFKARARESFGDMQAGHARTPSHFLASMSRAMRAEREAAVRGDWAEAERAREQVFVQKELAASSVRFRDRIHHLDRQARRWRRAKLGDVEEQHLSWMRHLLRRFGLADAPEVDPIRLKPFTGEDGQSLFPDAAMMLPDWLNSQETQQVDSWRELTTQQVMDLQETLEALDGQGRALLDQQVWWAGAKVEDLATKGARQMDGLPSATVANRATWGGRFLNSLRSGLSEIRQPIWLFRAADGNVNIRGDRASGFLEALFIDKLQERRSIELTTREAVTARAMPHLSVLRAWADRQPAQMTDLPMPAKLADPANPRGVSVAWSPDQVLALALNMGNDYNRHAVQMGYAISDTDLRQILRTLGAAEWQAIQGVWDTVSSLWPQISEQHYRLNKFHQRQVEANPFVTPDGTELRGGYYPLAFDIDLDTKAGERAELDDLLSSAAMMNPRAAARSGFTKSRTGTGGKPVLLNLSALAKHLDNVVRYIAYADVARDLYRVAQHGEFKTSMARAFGGEAHTVIRPWLAGIVRPQQAIRGWFDKSVEWFRGKVTPYLLGYNLGPVVFQPTSLYQSMQDLGTARVLKAASYVATNPVEAIGEARRQSVVIRDRMGGTDRDMRRDLQGLDLKQRGRLGRMVNQSQEIGFVPLLAVDQVMATITWHAAHDMALEQGADPLQALIRADKAVEVTQSSYSPIHQTQLQKSTNGIARLFTMFSTMTMLYGNRQRAYWSAWQRGQISASQLVLQTFMETAMPSLTVLGFYAMVHGRFSSQEEEERLLRQIPSDLLYWSMSGMPVLRDIASVAGQRAGILEIRGRPEIQTPLFGHMNRLAQRSGDVLGNVMTGLFDPAAAEAEGWVENTAVALGELMCMSLGLPADRVSGKLLEGYRQVVEEDGGPLHILFPDPKKR